jgi:hypothetical protein
VLKVFGGGFVLAYNDVNLVFPVTLPNKGGRKASSTEDDNLNTRGWSLPIQIIQGEVTNTGGSGIGMRSDALKAKINLTRLHFHVSFAMLNSTQESLITNLTFLQMW